jgi:uncharacterized protein (DUF488 family)
MDFERNFESLQLPLFSAIPENSQLFEHPNLEGIPMILSIGYESRKTESFIQTLIDYHVQAVVDVRESAFSRRLDFRKYRLISLLEDNGIEYFHLRNAGNPHRKISNNLSKCLRIYSDYISNEPTLINEITSELNRISFTYPSVQSRFN